MTKAFALAHAFAAQWQEDFYSNTFDSEKTAHQDIFAYEIAQIKKEIQQDITSSMATCDGSNAWDKHPLDCAQSHENCMQDMENCIDEHVAFLLHKRLWQPMQCEKMPLPLSIVFYDTATDITIAQASTLLQKSCNIVGEAHLDVFTPLVEDATCSAKTIAMCKALQECNLDFYTARLMVRQRILFYTKREHKTANTTILLKERKQRCAALLQYLAELEREI